MARRRPAAVEVDGRRYLRIPIRTHEIKPPDRLDEQLHRYVAPLIRAGDILTLSEKMVAATQGRLVPSDSIHPRRLALFLSNRVTKTPYGIGLGSPQTMELAIRECGTLRILVAAFFGAFGKVFRVRGLFYLIAGRQAAWIDGDAPYGMLRGNAVMGPKNPGLVCKELDRSLGCRVAILDVNDIGGCEICGASPGTDRRLVTHLMSDNPMGQDVEQTPMGILRPLEGSLAIPFRFR
jgi:F420-0:gamma-glutamyl ligase-like protein